VAWDDRIMAEPEQGSRLPLLLIGLTAVTGMVDAFSFLELGRVFVAAVTGSVLLFGFALAGAGGVSLPGTLIAFTCFATGALVGGRLIAARPAQHHHLLVVATGVQALILLASAAAATFLPLIRGVGPRHALVGSLALAMGLQTAVARRLAVRDLPTTLVTMTLTGLVADTSEWSVRRRRVAAVAALVVGGFVGASLVRWGPYGAPLWVAGAVVVAILGMGLLHLRELARSSRMEGVEQPP
jgi:uncharacterized membrane protein YoaK (UPF0700 family)